VVVVERCGLATEAELQTDAAVEGHVEARAEAGGTARNRVDRQAAAELVRRADAHARPHRPGRLEPRQHAEVEKGLPFLVAGEHAEEGVRRDAVALLPPARAQPHVEETALAPHGQGEGQIGKGARRRGAPLAHLGDDEVLVPRLRVHACGQRPGTEEETRAEGGADEDATTIQTTIHDESARFIRPERKGSRSTATKRKPAAFTAATTRFRSSGLAKRRGSSASPISRRAVSPWWRTRKTEKPRSCRASSAR